MMTNEANEAIRTQVSAHYAEVARNAATCCGPSCCSPASTAPGQAHPTTVALGYSSSELAGVPEGADLGLGCGNPHAIAALKEGETVLDLGSGGGLDCFVAARRVGPTGRVIGVDMTPEMVARARQNAGKAGLANVEFRLGEIEHLPVADGSVDAILSNCVINLAIDKDSVFREAHRVLKSGGRLAISDVVALRPIPPEVQRDLNLYTGCLAGAASAGELKALLAAAGFHDVRVEIDQEATAAMARAASSQGDLDLAPLAASAHIEARKP
jgi:arsenite methyltransferase